jgi:hypothetical protein
MPGPRTLSAAVCSSLCWRLRLCCPSPSAGRSPPRPNRATTWPPRRTMTKRGWQRHVRAPGAASTERGRVATINWGACAGPTALAPLRMRAAAANRPIPCNLLIPTTTWSSARRAALGRRARAIVYPAEAPARAGGVRPSRVFPPPAHWARRASPARPTPAPLPPQTAGPKGPHRGQRRDTRPTSLCRARCAGWALFRSAASAARWH